MIPSLVSVLAVLQQLGHGIADGVGAQLDAGSRSGGGATRYRRIGPIHTCSRWSNWLSPR